MKYKRSVYKTLALISQIGISMMVPIALCVALGIWIDRRFGTYWIIPLIFVGMAAGFRNVYHIAMSAMKDEDSKKEEGKEDRHE